MLHLISIFENTGSKESTQDVAYRGACTPQAKHKTTAEKEINGITFIYRTALSILSETSEIPLSLAVFNMSRICPAAEQN